MRDFKNGGHINVGGDFFVSDRPYQGKPLAECTNEELREEEQIRYRVLREEQLRKLKIFVILAATLVLAGAIFFWLVGFWFVDFREHFTSMISIAGVLATLGSAKLMTTPSHTELVADSDLTTINTIRRMRGARR